ncbi:MAG: LicD family protein [Pseudomonadota bacterium]
MTHTRPQSRTYRALKFARRPRGPFVRAVYAALGWGVAFVMTGRAPLAGEMRRRLLSDGDLILPLRRIAFYARRGWMNLPFVPRDAIFDFTQGLPSDALQSLKTMVVASQDHVVLTARALSEAPHDAEKRADFVSSANRLLNEIKLPPAHSNGRNGAAKRALDQGDSAVTLRDLAQAVPTDEVPWFVLSGTLLGLVRENRFLPHDDDIDIGLLTDGIDVPSVLERFSKLENFAVYKMDSQLPYPGSGLSEPRPMVLKLVHRTGVRVELFLNYQVSDTEVVVGTSVHHWINSPFELAPYELAGVPVLGPKDADRHLTENYGAWQTPVTDFNCTTSTPNVRLVRHPLSIVAFLRRLAAEAKAEDLGANKLAEELVQAGILRALNGQPDRFELVPELFAL